MKNNSWKEKLLPALMSNIFLAGTIFVFAPLEVYVGSFRDFHFGFGITCMVMTMTMLAVAAAVTLVEMLLPRKLALFFNALTVGVGVCCYVQMMFLNGKMTILFGGGMLTTRSERIMNLGIWAAIMAVSAIGALIVLKKKKPQLLDSVLCGISGMLTAMQAIALVIFALTTDMSSSGGYMLAGDGRFEVAPQNNTLVFILDSSENTIFNQVLERFPDTYEALSGFTYYPNTTGIHSRTYPSLIYLLSGEICHFDKPAQEYMREALEQGKLFGNFKEAGIDNRIFMWDIEKFTKAAEPYVSNLVVTGFDSFDKVSVPHLIGGMTNISLYKVMPYRLKYELEYQMENINQQVIRHGHEPYQYYDYDYYQDLIHSELTVDEAYNGAFRFYHLNGNHDVLNWDENMIQIEVDTKEQNLRGSMRIIEEFVKKLDEKGILDKTTIIVTADHGRNGKFGSKKSLDIKETQDTTPNPMLLVKYANSDMSNPMMMSNAPVSHEDMIPTILEGCGLDASGYGRTIREIPEDEERKRYYYHTAFEEETREGVVLKEYLIDGDANTFDNWEFTGNQWDIQYSIY